MVSLPSYVSGECEQRYAMVSREGTCKSKRGDACRQRTSPQAGSNHRPFAYEASALPLSYRGTHDVRFRTGRRTVTPFSCTNRVAVLYSLDTIRAHRLPGLSMCTRYLPTALFSSSIFGSVFNI
uniref:Uncharacterized protein n=1 Tax=Hyaloperonospora arabidopsidis (strain Emoy2) TaxID=559515 RepID=M4C6N7_HYAAE